MEATVHKALKADVPKGSKSQRGVGGVHGCALLIRQLCCNKPHITSTLWMTWLRQTKCHLGKHGSKWLGNQHSGLVGFCWPNSNQSATQSLLLLLNSTKAPGTTRKVSSKLVAHPPGGPSLLSPWLAFHFLLRSKEALGYGTSWANGCWCRLLVVLWGGM